MTRAESRIRAPIPCPYCFSPVEGTRGKWSRLLYRSQCHNCGAILDTRMVEILRDISFEFASKWEYKRIHEEDAKKGIQREYILLPPDGWLTYITALIFAGIIGGLSYDALKKLISSIRDRFREQFQHELPQEEWLQRLYDDIKGYYFSKRNPNSPIAKTYLKGLANGIRLAEAEQEKRIMKLESYLKKIRKHKGHLQ